MMIDKERLGNYPAITPKELEEAAAQAVRQTRAALVEFGEAFKGIYSEHNFTVKRIIVSGRMDSGQGNYGLPMNSQEKKIFAEQH